MERQPLEMDAFPAQLQRAVAPESPPQMKMMAARGMLPAPPEILLRVLYQLSFESDENVRGAAIDAVREMPVDVLTPAARKEQPAALLDWLAEQRLGDGPILQVVVTHPSVEDETVASIAAAAPSGVCDVIANNQVRVLRSPQILVEMYHNANARMATINGLIELAQRNDVDLSGIPGLNEALKSGQDIFTRPDGADDAGVDELLREESARAQAEYEQMRELVDNPDLTRSERERLIEELDPDGTILGDGEEGEEKEEDDRRPLFAKIATMSISDKVRLASVGSMEAVNVLVRESNKLVHMAAVKNPRVRPSDVRRWASNKSLPDNVISYIAGNRDWTGRNYDIKVALCGNPKTPLADTLGFLNHLRPKDLRDLSRNRNVPMQVSRMAKQLLKKQQSGRR